MHPSTFAEPLDAARKYGTDDVCRLAGLSYRTVDYWVRRGVISPEIAANGSGTSRRFTAEQVQEFRLAAALRRLGVLLDEIGVLVAAARSAVGACLIWTGTDVEWANSAQVVERVAELGGAAVVLTPAR